MNNRSTGLSSLASNLIGVLSRAKHAIGLVMPSISACGIATPFPIAVEPSFSRSTSISSERSWSMLWFCAIFSSMPSSACRRDCACICERIASSSSKSMIIVMIFYCLV